VHKYRALQKKGISPDCGDAYALLAETPQQLPHDLL
jgi:hypothetical protein